MAATGDTADLAEKAIANWGRIGLAYAIRIFCPVWLERAAALNREL